MIKFLIRNIILPIFCLKKWSIFSQELLRSIVFNFKNFEIDLSGSTIKLSGQGMASWHELKPKWWTHNGLPHWMGRWLWHWQCWHGVHQGLSKQKHMGHASQQYSHYSSPKGMCNISFIIIFSTIATNLSKPLESTSAG